MSRQLDEWDQDPDTNANILLSPLKSADAHLSSVKSYAAPAAPQAPTLPSDLTAELSKFDATEPVLSSSTSTADVTAASSEEGVAGGAKEYLEFLEKDLPKADAHH